VSIQTGMFATWKRKLSLLVVLVLSVAQEASPTQCPGVLNIPGTTPVFFTNAKWNTPGDRAASAALSGNAVVAYLKSRTYFANYCSEGAFSNTAYQAVPLLGMTMRYSVNLGGAGCGCNAALYLTSLQHNDKLSNCSDYYCDANQVCGMKCAEVDIQEANEGAWRSTLHGRNDSVGRGAGFGGTGPHRRAFSAHDYGPGSRCIDTRHDFDVAASFPVDSNGKLKAMELQLTQAGKPCDIFFSIDEYRDMDEVSEALRMGMTPIISYWRSKHMRWLDGTGKDGKDCKADHPRECADYVKFYGFTIGAYIPPTRKPTPPPTRTTTTMTTTTPRPTPAPTPALTPAPTPAPTVVPSTSAPGWRLHPAPAPAPQRAPPPQRPLAPQRPWRPAAWHPRPTPAPSPWAYLPRAPAPQALPVPQPLPAPQALPPPRPLQTMAPAPQPPTMSWISGAYPWARVTGRAGIYYYNTKTMQVTWTPPAALV